MEKPIFFYFEPWYISAEGTETIKPNTVLDTDAYLSCGTTMEERNLPPKEEEITNEKLALDLAQHADRDASKLTFTKLASWHIINTLREKCNASNFKEIVKYNEYLYRIFRYGNKYVNKMYLNPNYAGDKNELLLDGFIPRNFKDPLESDKIGFFSEVGILSDSFPYGENNVELRSFLKSEEPISFKTNEDINKVLKVQAYDFKLKESKILSIARRHTGSSVITKDANNILSLKVFKVIVYQGFTDLLEGGIYGMGRVSQISQVNVLVNLLYNIASTTLSHSELMSSDLTFYKLRLKTMLKEVSSTLE